MKSLMEAAIAIFIVWLFIEWKNGQVHVSSTMSAGNPFNENPSNGYGTAGSLGTTSAPASSTSSSGGCCGGCSGASGGNSGTLSPIRNFPSFPPIVIANTPTTGPYLGSVN